MKLFGIAGWSGSGKTTLVTSLLPVLVRNGYRVSTVKHAHHEFDVDTPGKDSYEHREAGAAEVLVTSSRRWALLHENRDEPEPTLNDLVSRLTPVDLVLIEGFKREPFDKLEVFRKETGQPLLQPNDPHVVAVASTDPLPGSPVPVLDLNDIEGIAAFIATHCRIDRHAADLTAQGR